MPQLVLGQSLQRSHATLIDLIAQVPREAVLRDAAILEPGIEDAIRTHYQGRARA